MPKFRLRALTPGRRFVGYHKDGSKRFFDFTPEFCRQQFARNSEMVKADVPVPVCWGHRNDIAVGRMSQDDLATARARGTAGRVEGYELAADGSGAFDALVDIPDADDARKAEVVRFCSPEIDYVTDGTGRDWGVAISHLALTPRPVQHPQPPIARLSILDGGPIRLALDPSKGTDMADDAAEVEDTEDDETGPETPEPAAQTPEDLKALVAALRKKGFTIPEMVKDLNDIVIAVEASTPPAPIAAPDPKPEADGGQVVEGAAAPMTLSLPEQKAQQRAEAMTRKEITGRITKLVNSGRITPDLGKKLTSEATKIRLSFTDAGDVAPNDVLTKIEAYEALGKHTAWKPTGERTRLGLEAREAAPPYEEPPTAKDDDKVVDEYEATVGRR